MTTKLQPTNIDVTLNYSMNQLSANVMVTNGINLQSVNDTQNTNITTATSTATSAGSYANSAFTQANTAVTTINSILSPFLLMGA